MWFMYATYVLKSLTHNTRYIGSTEDEEKRLNEHNSGKCRYTRGRMPWEIVYVEKFPTRAEAMAREKFFKTGQGRKFLDQIIQT